MAEHEDEYDQLPEENAWDSLDAWLSLPAAPNLIRGCRYERQRPGHWSFWTGDVRWGLFLQPQKTLFRKGELILGAEQVRCLDDAVLYALGYEEGITDMARERKEGPL